MVRKIPTPLVQEQTLRPQLQKKSRQRRKGLLELAKASAAPQKRRNDLLPQLELVSIRLDDLNLPERKIRKCAPAHVREVRSSVSAFGFCAPILVGKGNLVVDGEIRVQSAKALGLATVPCIRIDHLTEVEPRTLRLAVNRLGEKGEWVSLSEIKSGHSDGVIHRELGLHGCAQRPQ
jgi:hypothetical protein